MRAYCSACDAAVDAEGPWPGRCGTCSAAIDADPLPDVVADGLPVLFVGINPGILTARTGHHFANPGNQFWPALHEAGFTPRLFAPSEQARLTEHGAGVTNVVGRATPGSADVTPEDVAHGRERLAELVKRVRPRWVAFVGKDAYRMATGRKDAVPHGAAGRFHGARVFVLPSTSGRNAHVSRDEKVAWFKRLHGAVDA